MVKWNGPFRSDRSNREKRSTSKGGPLFSKLFRLDLTDPFSFRPKFPEILVEWIAPIEKESLTAGSIIVFSDGNRKMAASMAKRGSHLLLGSRCLQSHDRRSAS